MFRQRRQQKKQFLVDNEHHIVKIQAAERGRRARKELKEQNEKVRILNC